MNIVIFSKAKAVFVPWARPDETTVNQYGFYYALDLRAVENNHRKTVIRLTARNVYRLYVNGTIVMHGPARTAHEYCRVDEIDITNYLIADINHIAVEVIEYGVAHGKYSNASTLESGLLIAEIVAGDHVLAATGVEDWLVCPLAARVNQSERISHCRESSEVYTLDEAYVSWKKGVADFSSVAVLNNEPTYLAHQALMPSLQAYSFDELLDFGACCIDESTDVTIRPYYTNAPYYASLKDHPTVDCKKTVASDTGSVKVRREKNCLKLSPSNTDDFYAFWDGGENRVGFVRLKITCERAGTIDIVPTELLNTDGSIYYGYYFVTRIHVPAGTTEFVAMEPMIARYVKLIFRGVGQVTIHDLSMLDDTYPDEHRASFLCNDEYINALYKAAKRTLLLNTLDVFMDCPGRERGGWLCDSLWTGRAASLMLADDRVEKEFIENFLLTAPEEMFASIFPAVYPASSQFYKERPEITTWSFWLMCEVCEYIRRTGDTAFRDEYKSRIVAFIEGISRYIGKSGLLERVPAIFIDWSLANNSDYHQPVSTPTNALFAYMMIALGETFVEPEWVTLGQKMRTLLRKAIVGGGKMTDIKHIPDCFNVDENGALRARGLYTEAAMYTTLWTELFTIDEAPLLLKTVRDQMGPAPLSARNPNVGLSGLFIGLCIRLDMLSRYGYENKMFEDMQAIFMPQLREGPGTLWEQEYMENNSRCHGFNAHVGVHLMRDVLGLDIPAFDQKGEGEKSITIAPHVCGLRWAKGTHETPYGIIRVSWKYDGESFDLKISLPESMACHVELPREVRMLDEGRVSVVIDQY